MREHEQQKQHVAEHDRPQLEHEQSEREQEEEQKTRFGSGQPPAIGGAFGDQAGTANLAFEEDEHEKELKQKVSALVAKKFGGDYKKAFEHYDRDKDGAVQKSELVSLLAEAGVGNGLTRGIWASKIVERLDSGGDSAIEWAEFESVFTARA
jgi:hypothetical protein